jgi:flagellar motor switch protein FliN
MNAEQAVDHLTESAAQAVVETLQTFCGEEIQITGSTVAPRGTDPLDGLEFPAVTASISYSGGVSGGNMFATTAAGARKIAAAMMGGELDDDGNEVPELALSTVGEAANQMFAAATATTAKVLGEEIEIDPPRIRVVTDGDEAMTDEPITQHVISVSFSLLGEPCRLVQLIPQSFIVGMQFALQERAGEIDPADAASAVPGAVPRGTSGDWLRESKLRLSVELGRSKMPASKAVTLPSGAIVELDRQADEPVDLYVNGAPFAKGRLLLVGGSDWAVRIESFHNASARADANPDPSATAS